MQDIGQNVRAATNTDQPSEEHTNGGESISSTQLKLFPIPARLLIATPRLCGRDSTISPLERCVLDAIGRVLDAGADREKTIEAINEYSSVVLTQTRLPLDIQQTACAELSSDENMLLYAASQQVRGDIRATHTTLEWHMEKAVRQRFINAVSTLADARCFRRLGQHVFTARTIQTDIRTITPDTRHHSVVRCDALSFSEHVVVNAARLWVRGISLGFKSERAIECFADHLALPELGTALHYILHETAHNAIRQFDMRCLCCDEISPDEARLLAALAALTHSNPSESVAHLRDWLPDSSIQGVLVHAPYIRRALSGLDDSLPLRQWDFEGLLQRQVLFDHANMNKNSHSIH